MLVFLLSLDWDQRTAMFQLSGFYCGLYCDSKQPSLGSACMDSVFRSLVLPSCFAYGTQPPGRKNSGPPCSLLRIIWPLSDGV